MTHFWIDIGYDRFFYSFYSTVPGEMLSVLKSPEMTEKITCSFGLSVLLRKAFSSVRISFRALRVVFCFSDLLNFFALAWPLQDVFLLPLILFIEQRGCILLVTLLYDLCNDLPITSCLMWGVSTTDLLNLNLNYLMIISNAKFLWWG